MLRYSKLSLFFALLLILSGLKASAQEKAPSRYALNIGIGTGKVGVPFRKIMDFPNHSSYHLGIERKWDKSGVKKHFQTLDIFAFENNSAGSGYTIQSAFGVNIAIMKGVYFSPSIGGGMVHFFRPKESFSLIDGTYKSYTDLGKMLPDFCMSIKVTYQLKRLGLFGAYHMNALFGYSKDIGVLPYTFLTVGGRYEI